MDELIKELKIKLIDTLNLMDVTPDDIDENAQFVGGELGIDSIDVLEMVVMIEKDYQVTINNKEIGEKVFSTLTALAGYISENSSRFSS
ncbi:MAG TPA: acyl carrier protein [Desulfobacterales bacterium]|nr:acyl carrier protein [Desulfobacterales bacterium]